MKRGSLSVFLALLSLGFGPRVALAQASGDEFPHGPLPEGVGCADCHSTQGWSPLDPDRSFDHGEVTGFRLVGGHSEAPCASCHQDLRFGTMDVVPEECGRCHVDVHQGTLSADCARCHTPQGFSMVSGIRIHQTTGFPLEGAHLQQTCESCHTTDRGGSFAPLPTNCLECHRGDFQTSRTVDHVTLGFPENCLTCHTPRSWGDVASFDHATYSGGFLLQGVHEELVCGECHIPGGGLRFPSPAGPSDCVSCHQADYQREHAGSGYPTTCTTCHSGSSWDDAIVDHPAFSGGYVLEGAHDGMACTSCHTPDGAGNLFAPTGPGGCVACHQADYQREHAGSGYPTICTECHTASTWDDARVDHAALADGFPLEGAHEGAPCISCHTPDGAATLFAATGPDDCVACHQADYQREHQGSGYPTECVTCHTVSTWEGAQVDHAAVSGGYVLEGAHDGLACTSCHTPDGAATLFAATGPDDCVACHQADYQREHAETGYPTNCATCHSVSSWEGAQGDHLVLSGGFVLVGNHDQLSCASCHILPDLQSIFSPSDPEDCLACHLADFEREHGGTGYPGTCLTCHALTTWTGAQFDHDGAFFPIYSGTHQGQWTTCTECHSSPADYGIFSCLNCHEHRQDQVDADHTEVTDYVYESGQCLLCHPVGKS